MQPETLAPATAEENERVRFVTNEERAMVVEALTAEGAMVVAIDALGWDARGRLAEIVEDAVERELSARGAAAPGLSAASDPDAALSDQLYRARRAGGRSLCVSLGSLRGATSARGALEAEDCETLRFFARATHGRPLVLLLDASDASTGAFGDPVPLASLIDPSDAMEATPTPTVIETSTTPPTATEREAPSPTASRHTAGASVARPDDAWRHWTLQLGAARGPQPLAVFERLFAQSYMPLANAIGAGLDDPRAKQAHDEFRRAFEKSYSDACPTFASTGKRPKMVLDAVDIANRCARLHGARTVQLLVVDGMRWDIGQHARTLLGPLLGARAAVCDELILWSALPTTTARQLMTLARGVEALRVPVDQEPELESLRGRTAEHVRRMRVGSRDLYKLDLVEARVREAGTRVLDALPTIGESVARVVAHHAEGLAPRTLLFVIGDHGFSIDKSGAARHGGASPEEVLVPAWALLVGDVH